MTELIIVGTGGFGREVYHWLLDWLEAEPSRQKDYRIKGFLSLDPDNLKGFGLPVSVIGDEDSYAIQANDQFVVGIGNVAIKTKVVTVLKQKNAKFFTLIHPKAYVCRSATIGEGSLICPMVTVCAHAVVGDFAMLNLFVGLGHDSKVGDFSILSPYATLNGFAELESSVFMGTHSTVTAGKRVGEGSKISANTLVTTNVPAQTTVLGTPGKMMKNLSF